MSGFAQKFQAPSLGANSDAGKAMKLAQRVELILGTCVNGEPRHLDPRSVVVSPQNRDGAPPNVQHIHQGILRSLAQNGFDRSRPAMGICVQLRSPEAKLRAIEWNKRITAGNPLLPPIHEDLVGYASLAGSHLNLALRLIKAGVPSPACDITAVAPSGSALADLVSTGHRWWILPEDTDLDAQLSVSLWRNQDQNENQSTHEVELLRGIVGVCAQMSTVRSSMTLADIVAKAQRRTPAKVQPHALESIAKYFVRFLENKAKDLALEICDFHACRVNPHEIMVPPSFFGTLASEENLKRAPHVRHYLLMANYTTERVRHSAGMASTAAFPDVELLEDIFRSGREKYLPILERQLPHTQALLEFGDFAVVLIRSAMAKPLPEGYHRKGSSATARFGRERAEFLGAIWASLVHARYPDLEFPKASGLVLEPEGAGRSEEQIVSLATLATDRAASEADLSGSASLRPGDDIVVIKRFTWVIPVDGNSDFRKDITVGTLGKVIGYADAEHRQVLVTIFSVPLPGPRGIIRKDVTEKAWPHNLKLKAEHDAVAAAAPATPEPIADASGASGPSVAPPRTKTTGAWAFLQQGVAPEDQRDIVVEKTWPKLLDHDCSTMQSWFLRGRVAFAAQAILEALPQFGPSDLCVVHRETSKGSWKQEVWTRRDFSARELLVPALTTDLREVMWTKGLHAFIGLPKNGAGRHPEGKQVAMDGRGRSVLASAGTIEAKEKVGSLFWCVERTSDASLANLEVEQISVTANLEVLVPSAKKRKVTLSRSASEMPALPAFVNPKPIKAHTRLWLRHDDATPAASGPKPKASGAASSSPGR